MVDCEICNDLTPLSDNEMFLTGRSYTWQGTLDDLKKLQGSCRGCTLLYRGLSKFREISELKHESHLEARISGFDRVRVDDPQEVTLIIKNSAWGHDYECMTIEIFKLEGILSIAPSKLCLRNI